MCCKRNLFYKHKRLVKLSRKNILCNFEFFWDTYILNIYNVILKYNKNRVECHQAGFHSKTHMRTGCKTMPRIQLLPIVPEQQLPLQCHTLCSNNISGLCLFWLMTHSKCRWDRLKSCYTCPEPNIELLQA